MISQILVPTDDSKIAKKAVRYAIDLAGRLKASIILLAVIDDRALIAQSTPIDLSHSRITVTRSMK
jgi:nucleotide-binding universal stress UspA family protein